MHLPAPVSEKQPKHIRNQESYRSTWNVTWTEDRLHCMFIAFQDFVNPVGTPVNVKDTKTKCNVQCVQSRCDEQPTRRAVGDVMAAACVCELLKSHIICEQSLFQACQVLCRYTMIRSVFTTSCGLSAKMTCVHRRRLGSCPA